MSNKEIDILELFSGIGGFTKGFQKAGYKINNHYYSEVDKHAIANYRYNFKNSTYVGSVTNVRGIIRTVNQNRSGKLVITFGSPCQDFSLAGKGLGLDGNKSSLIKYAIFLIKWLRPDVFIWENVKGAFSTNDGADYWAIIQAFTNLDGYRCEQQLLNTSWFLPQNRERIYFVGHLTGRSELGVFPIRKKHSGINEGSSETRNTRTLTAGGHSGGMHSSMTLINEVGRLNSSQDGIVLGTDGLSQCLSAGHGNVPKIQSGTLRTHKDGKGFRESSGDNCPTLPARAREDGSGQVVIQINPNKESGGKQPYQGNRVYDTSGVMPALHLDSRNNIQVSKVVSHYGHKNKEPKISDEVPTLKAESHGHEPMVVVKTNTKKGFETAKEGDSINLSNPNSETRRGRVGVGVAQTLDTQCNQAVVTVGLPQRTEEAKEKRKESMKNGIDHSPFQERNIVFKESDVINTITCATQKDNIISVVKPVLTPNRTEKRQNGRRFKENGEDAFTLSCQDQHGVQINNSIRRLTEIECERLQGFDDDWTKYGIYEKQVWINKKEKTFEIVEELKEIPKTQRYKMCGNAVTTDVVQAIAENLKLT